VTYIKNIFLDNRDRLQFSLFLFAGSILLLYSIILTFAPVIRTLNWQTPMKWEHWIGYGVWLISSFFIHKLSVKYLPNRDPYLIPIAFLLSGIGLMTIFRLSIPFGWRQLIWFGLCSVILLIGMKYPGLLNLFRRYKYIWLTVGLMVTGLTFFFGIYPGGEGPRLWLGCCGIYFQPSEPLKLLFIIYLSAFFADNWALRNNFSILIMPSLVMVGAAILLLFAQRDLGTAIIFLIIYAFYIFIVSGKRRTVFIFLGFILIAGYLGYQYFNVIQIRIDGWINPWVDPSGGSYQIIQSIQAIAAGHILGTGPGLGSPGIVPVAISDFIFSSISEELGLLGSLFVITLFGFLAFRGFSVAIKGRNNFQKLLASGISVFLCIQAILIMGGNTRLLPLTGVTLPFISYGGSSLVTVFISLLLLIWISQYQTSKFIIKEEVRPFIFSYSMVIIGFICLGLITSYWAIIQSDKLLNRTDNFRKVINDLYVPRGDILDRQNNPILTTVGVRGEYTRLLLEPSLSTTVGYNQPFLGQSGLEKSLDSYLRGLAGIPASSIWLNELLFARPPDGLDIRTTIDLTRQNQLVSNLEDFKGAAVIMNAKTGEILALWSEPNFDLNQINESFEELANDPGAPFLNRVSQGKYDLNNLSSLFYFGFLTENAIEIKDQNFVELGKCAIPITASERKNLNTSLMNGCQDGQNLLRLLSPSNQVNEIIENYMWDESYQFELPIQPISLLEPNSSTTVNQLLISPLQVARSLSVFSNAGYMPYPRIALAVNSPNQGWIVLSTRDSIQVMDNFYASRVANFFARKDFPTWEMTSSNNSETQPTHWYVTGTLPDWKGTPIVFVLTLENGETQDAQRLGRKIMEDILTSGSN